MLALVLHGKSTHMVRTLVLGCVPLTQANDHSTMDPKRTTRTLFTVETTGYSSNAGST